eukprot:7378677-Prymnesium_polylepis.1
MWQTMRSWSPTARRNPRLIYQVDAHRPHREAYDEENIVEVRLASPGGAQNAVPSLPGNYAADDMPSCCRDDMPSCCRAYRWRSTSGAARNVSVSHCRARIVGHASSTSPTMDWRAGG